MSIIHTNLTIEDVLMDFDPRPEDAYVLQPHDGIFLPPDPSIVGVGMSNNKFKQCMKLHLELFLVQDAGHNIQLVAAPWKHSTSMACLKLWTQEEYNAACAEVFGLPSVPDTNMTPLSIIHHPGSYRWRLQFNMARNLWRAS